MADSNYTEKPLLEKIQDLLQRKQENYDVAFRVGKEKIIVKGLKIMLKASSPLLEKTFEEQWEVAVVREGDGIPLPEFDPFAFKLFIKLISLDTWSVENLKALNLPLNQILNLLSICRSFEIKKAEENLKILSTIFLKSFSKYKDTEDFLQLSRTNLYDVLGSDEIEVTELDVFHAAIRWAKFECKQNRKEPTQELLRDVLGQCFFQIRFPIMTCAEFTEVQEDSQDILTREESLAIYKSIGLTGDKTKMWECDAIEWLPFTSRPRKKLQTSEFNLNLLTNQIEVAMESRRHGHARVMEGLENLRREIQLRSQSLESSSSQLTNAASLSITIRWGEKISGMPLRNHHAAVAVDNVIYSLGGECFDIDPSYSRDVLDVFVLNVNERKTKWKKLLIENNEVNPNQRSGHSAVVHKQCVLVFGGLDEKTGKELNSTYRFNTQTMKWDKPTVTGIIPGARRFHSAVVFKNEVLIYGGMGNEITNDLHSLNMDTFHWSTIKTKGIPPSLRWGHTATVHSERVILVFGGKNSEETPPVNTIHSFDLENKTWTVVYTRGTSPSPRNHHCAFVHDGLMYIFGGYDENYFNDVFSYDPDTFKWKEITPNGEAPSPRCAAGCVALNDQVFIFGGKGNKKYLDDTFVLQM